MSDSPERSMGKLLRFPTGRRNHTHEQRSTEQVITPEMVGTVVIYRYYGETGNTYPVDSKASGRFLPYVHMLVQMYGLTMLDGQPDQKGKVHEKFVFETTAPEKVPPEKRFCAVLQLGEEGSVTSVSFRMLANRQFSYSQSSAPRLRLIPRTRQ